MPLNHAIMSFKDTFLSNMYDCNVEYNGILYSNSESAFQAQKQPEKADMFIGISGKKAKQKGKHLKLREDWDYVKYDIMQQICEAKFLQNPELFNKLKQTNNLALIEGNNWGDTYWGVVDGVGENNLGKILMDIRSKEIPAQIIRK